MIYCLGTHTLLSLNVPASIYRSGGGTKENPPKEELLVVGVGMERLRTTTRPGELLVVGVGMDRAQNHHETR